MEVKKIVEGMTAPQVAQVIDDNFKGLNEEKANKVETDAKLSELGSKDLLYQEISLQILENHSSKNDRVRLDAEKGQRFAIQIDCPTEWYLEIYAYSTEEGTNGQIIWYGNPTGDILELTAKSFYKYIGFTVVFNSIPGILLARIKKPFYMHIEDSFAEQLNLINKVENGVEKVKSESTVLRLPLTANHSALQDKIFIGAEIGETFSLDIEGNAEWYLEVRGYSGDNGEGSVYIYTGNPKKGITYTPQQNIKWVGVTVANVDKEGDLVINVIRPKQYKDLFYNGVAFIGGGVLSQELPNIDTSTGIMTLRGVIVVKNKHYTIDGKSFSLKNGYTTSALKVVFDTELTEFRSIPYSQMPNNNEVVIGGMRLNEGASYSQYEVINFPFDFTIDGIKYSDLSRFREGKVLGYADTYFNLTQADHSSTKDKIYCSIPRGEVIEIGYDSDGEVLSIFPTLFYVDGTTKQIQISEKKLIICAEKDIESIGIYYNKSHVLAIGKIHCYVRWSFFMNDYELEAVKKIQGISNSFINASTSQNHSSTLDRLYVDVEENKPIAINVQGIVGNITSYGLGVFYEGKESAILEYGLKPNEEIIRSYPKKVASLGLYLDKSWVTNNGIILFSARRADQPIANQLVKNAFTGVYSEVNVMQPSLAFAEILKDAGKIDTFLFFTDTHLGDVGNTEFPSQTFREYIGEVQKYYNSIPIDHIICGGDWLNSGESQQYALYKLGCIDATMRKLFKGYIPMLGNHDTNFLGVISDTDSSAGTLSNQQIINAMFRQEGSAYYSKKANNSTLVVFDTGIDWATTMTDYRWEQIDWFGKLLERFEGENLLLFLHIYYEAENQVSALANNIAMMSAAYNNAEGIFLNGQNYDFTSRKGKVRAMICGHSHFDEVTNNKGIPIVLTDWFQRDNTPTFDMCIADFTNAKLSMIRVGSGENRVVDLI